MLATLLARFFYIFDDECLTFQDLSYGADSNGSGVIALLELIRIFSHLYSNKRSHAPINLVFLLAGGGKYNFQGSKKWLEDQLDVTDNTLLQVKKFDVKM